MLRYGLTKSLLAKEASPPQKAFFGQKYLFFYQISITLFKKLMFYKSQKTFLLISYNA